ncbi:MAG: Gfo/Idh/MocA family oxidoreductase [candidate division WS1 bacterium]|nr:Gfo/Idh/MocA family oxidoreductase [candidate division WS1 bacterium]
MHAYGYRSIPLFYEPLPFQTQLVGVAEVDEARAAAAAEQGGFEFGTADWRELIGREDIQIINICSPNSLHADQVLEAIAAGKHIYCEKPLVVDPADAARVATALEDYQGVGQMTLEYRFYPPTLRAKQLIEEGFLGDIISFRAAYLHSGSVDAKKPMGWKQLKSEGGGVLQDLGSHVVDLMEHLMGPFAEILTETRILYPQRPNAAGELVPVEADDQTLMMVKLPNGATGTLEASKIATGAEDEMRFEIHGTQGGLRFNAMDPNYLEAYDLREPETPLGGQRGWRKIATVQRYDKPAGFPGPKFAIGWIRGHMHCLYNFLDTMVTGREPSPSLHRGLEIHRLLAMAQESAQKREWRKL